MARTRVVLTDGMQELLRSDGVRSVLESRGEAVLAAARSTAPVRTGAYRDSLRLWSGETDRAAVRIGSDVPYAALIQGDDGHLSRALDAAGG